MRNKRIFNFTLSLLFILTFLAYLKLSHAQESFSSVSKENIVPVAFVALVASPSEDKEKAFQYISENWEPTFPIMVIEAIYLSNDPPLAAKLIKLLEQKTGKDYGYQLDRWYDWIWNNDEMVHSQYPEFKSLLYGLIDPKFAGYFSSGKTSNIRLDEVRWGGVRQDGIPPLRNPKMINAKQAKYLDDDNIVFGIEVNGDARAYPKRIMAWHEMFVDNVGDTPVAGVYCTLCGSMILYNTEHEGVNHKIGTSGFLYRSNKLMYDKDTQSLWNTLWGKPVIGELADKDIELERMSVVTTTWGEWKKRHPETKVLSLDTGHKRDYAEGAAYREYFATDELMFNVPKLDKRLKNKDEVLGLVFSQHADKPVAIRVDYLLKNPVFHKQIGEIDFVVLTDKSGAARVYEAKGLKFKNWDQESSVTDVNGKKWVLTESKLTSPDGTQLFRLPAHRAFWFGWYGAYSNTELIL
ncbi:MAG: hypothetical protein DHS20C13_00430 [Thermodesulfobacteriota bacterium]|nr:MAG: hypothetical protein DHS20C13_00430 [Thermodesulfobacteriota bacterium]